MSSKWLHFASINNGRHEGLLESERCKLTKWSAWSSCSSTCGEGSKTRSRNFVHKEHRKHCRAVLNGLPLLQQSLDCGNKPCEGEDTEEVRRNHLNDDEDNDYATLRDEAIGEDFLEVRKGSSISGLNQMETRFPTKLIREVRNFIKL